MTTDAHPNVDLQGETTPTLNFLPPDEKPGEPLPFPLPDRRGLHSTPLRTGDILHKEATACPSSFCDESFSRLASPSVS